jgi:hypothetical protein
MDPIPLGTVVIRISDGKRYVVDGHEDPWKEFSLQELAKMGEDPGGVLAEEYPDGVAYTIFPEGMSRKFGNRDYSVYRVRRKSLTVVNDAGMAGGDI